MPGRCCCLVSGRTIALAAGLTGLFGLFFLSSPGPEAHAAAAPRATAGFQTTDKVILNIDLPGATGDLAVELVGPDGKVLARSARAVAPADGPQHRFEFGALKVSADKVKVRCLFGKKPVEVALKSILLAKAHETTLVSSRELFAGTEAALRCSVHGVKSLAETIPLPGSSVTIDLRGADGKIKTIYKGKVGPDGTAEVRFKVPSVPAGTYKLQVVTKSTFGEEKLEHDVRVQSTLKVMLTSDKPLYQPGQLMHLRVLALRPFDLKPVGKADLTLEVEDAKGNKVFKRALTTSDHGIAAVDFQLADEVNNGDYRIRALLGDHTAEKTVTVKPYVLPKFKSTLKTDKSFYLPKETVRGELQVDYFFGKPVAGAKVQVKASTFDVAFKEFHTFNGKTDASGHVKFEVKLPAYFVGIPLQKGNAVVRLEAKITDTADHAEVVSRTYPVSDRSIRVTLIPEGGRLVPELQNKVFAAALYPDGAPAQCEVKVWLGREGKGKAFATVKTNDAGLAEVMLTPKQAQFRQGSWQQRNAEMLGGTQQVGWAPANLFDLTAEARDRNGNVARTVSELTSEPFGENVLLRLDKAIYKGGESVKIDLHSSAGLPTAYLDVVKSGQTLLTRVLDVKAGKASYKLDLPAATFGTLEVHAYQMLSSGEIVRDTRVVYVSPANDLQVRVKADKGTYLPGAEGIIRFEVVDAKGRPTQAALGVMVVDEAVYALQEMQPGLEKVYFTLQEELLKPSAQAIYRPSENLDTLVRRQRVPADRQQVAQVLLTSVRPKPPAMLYVDPALARRQQLEVRIQQIGGALYAYAEAKDTILVKDKATDKWTIPLAALEQAVRAQRRVANLTDPVGGKLTPEVLAKLEKGFNADRLARAVTFSRLVHLVRAVTYHSNYNAGKWSKAGKWTFPDTMVADAVRAGRFSAVSLKDGWGNEIKLLKRTGKSKNTSGQAQFDDWVLVSPGPDGKFGTADDIEYPPAKTWWNLNLWWHDHGTRNVARAPRHWRDGRGDRGGMGGGPGGRGFPRPGMHGAPRAPGAKAAPGKRPDFGPPPGMGEGKGGPGGTGGAGGAPPTRLREYFPETLFWRPELLTDERGRAELRLPFADSITTWRLTASASSRGGSLGGATMPLRVFQDFFVDLDMPVELTQNDEVAFPVAVYNYLKAPQTVTLDLEPAPWFELVDGLGLKRKLELQPNQVTSIRFRIKAKKVGRFPLTVKATGSKTSDAIKRSIDVAADGRKVEQVVTDRLKGKVVNTIVVPADAVPDASRLFVKVYPGVFSQLLEGTEGMLRLPNGCFEQTSSSAYPNILVADYMRRTRTGSPATRMKAEQFLNVGYQRLLTFERPGGGFDWWGNGAPLVWLSAYGLQEFNDMAKVYPVDKGVIERTQKWLMKQQAADGTWSNIGATHGVSLERMGDPKLLLTSYVAWSILDSMPRPAGWNKTDDYKKLSKAIEYIRKEAPKAENAYILALAANALAAWDAKDDSTHAALKKLLTKLDAKKVAVPAWRAANFPAQGQSLSYARDDSLTVETTALAVLAMVKHGGFTNSVNSALIYLVKSKGPGGTWGSTQATILSLKALVAGAGGATHKGKVPFVIKVNGREAARGEVTEANADVLQQFDLKDFVQVGRNEVVIETAGETALMYQVVGRHFEPWTKKPEGPKPILEVDVAYDRTRLSTSDLLKAKATLKYNGKVPTYQVIVDLAIPPGFQADPGDFAELVGAKKVQKFSVTRRQIILYLGDVKPGSAHVFEYGLKPKYPIRAKTPASVAYEYYTPANRATTKPVTLVVEERKK